MLSRYILRQLQRAVNLCGSWMRYFEVAPTFRFVSRVIDRADVIIFGVMDSVVKRHRLHNLWVWPGSVWWMVLRSLRLDT